MRIQLDNSKIIVLRYEVIYHVKVHVSFMSAIAMARTFVEFTCVWFLNGSVMVPYT